MTYENIYGLGYERATEPGPDVELLKDNGEWTPRGDNVTPLSDKCTYRRRIKLQVGHRYVRRDGVVVKVFYYEPMNMPGFRFWCSDNKSRHENGAYTTKEQTKLDLVTHIEEPETNEEPMNTVTVNNVEVNVTGLPRECVTTINGSVNLTHAQIEAAHAEMMKQKQYFKAGDIVLCEVGETSDRNFIMFAVSDRHDSDTRKKVTGTPEFMAQLRTKLEGK